MGKKIILEDGKTVLISDESYNELQRSVNELRTPDRLQRSVNELRTPDSIVFERNCGEGDGLGIVFNDKRQVLRFEEGVYIAGLSSHYDFVKHLKLLRVGADELRPGCTYYRTDDENDNFTDLSNYCKYLGNGKYAFVCYNSNVIVNNCNWSYWYEVVDIEEGD